VGNKTGKAKIKPKVKVQPVVRRVKPKAKKPVIYLYPASACGDTTVAVQLSGREVFTTVLPTAACSPHRAEWRLSSALPDGTLQLAAGGPPVSSLFWEATGFDAGTLLPEGARDTFCVAGPAAGNWLLTALAAHGLTPREYTEFASFWAPEMQGYNFVHMRFLPQAEIEALAPLKVVGLPGALKKLRLFLAWRGVDAYEERFNLGALPRAPFPRTVAANGGGEVSIVVEWGGQEIVQ